MKSNKISTLHLYIIVLFVLFSFKSFSQVKVVIEKWDNDTPKVVKIYPGNGKDTSKYQLIEYYRTGKKFQDANYVDNHPDGKVCYWYEGDKCQQEAIYKSGKEVQSKTYSEDGIIIETHVALEGSRDKDTKFYPNGLKKSEIIYDSLVSRQGKSSFWYNNGQLQKQGIFVNDKEQGLWKYFNQDGKMIDSIIYHNGISENASSLDHIAGKWIGDDLKNKTGVPLPDNHSFISINIEDEKVTGYEHIIENNEYSGGKFFERYDPKVASHVTTFKWKLNKSTLTIITTSSDGGIKDGTKYILNYRFDEAKSELTFIVNNKEYVFHQRMVLTPDPVIIK